MPAETSASPAGREFAPLRERLLSGWQLAGLGIAVVVALVLIFPQQRLIEQATHRQETDALTVSYLTNLLRTDPGNTELRLKLAEKKLAVGDVAGAQLVLAPVFRNGSEADRRRARLAEFRILEVQFHGARAGTSERTSRQARLVQELERLAPLPWDAGMLRELAGKALELGRPGVAADLYVRLAATGPADADAWLGAAAKAALGQGDYRRAAELHFAAQAQAGEPARAREHFLAGVQALQSGNLVAEALEAAERHRGALRDDELLRYLIGLAQAGNDLRRAERYVKELLRMSRSPGLRDWIAGFGARLIALAGALVQPAIAAAPASPQPPPPGMRPFDEETYTLAFRIFVANRNLADARRLADAAVRQVPDSVAWRERLAQVSEWDAKPADALAQWLAIAQRTGNDAAWQAVLRLAPGLYNDDALMLAWEHQSRSRALTDAQWQVLIDASERAGRPERAVALLEAELAKAPRRFVMEALARLYERMGRSEPALAMNRRLLDAAGRGEAAGLAVAEVALRTATLLFTRGDFRGAFEVLDRHRDRAGTADAAYWRVFAELAWTLQRDDAALVAYGRLARSGTTQADTVERLVSLMQERQPEEAARLAEDLFRRTGDTRHVLTALDLHARRNDTAAQRRIFGSLPPEALAKLQDQPYFLALRARVHQESGNAAAAASDLRRLAVLEPEGGHRVTLLWLLIDTRNLAELRREVSGLDAATRERPALWSVLAAAHMTLGEPGRAVGYFAREAAARDQDYLWLLSYADALELARQAGMADRVRRHAWVVVRRALATVPADGRPARSLAEANVRLALAFSAGDEVLGAVRYLLRQDFAIALPEPGLDASMKELLLSWMLSTEQHEAARGWMLRNYSRTLAQPRWAELSLALYENDLDAVERMLALDPDELPRYDRIEAARRLHRIRYAQTLAFEAQEQHPADDEVHLRLTDALLQTVGNLTARQVAFERGVLRGHETGTGVAVWLTPSLRMSAEITSIHQESRDATVITGVPGNDRAFGLTLTGRHALGETQLSVFRREALTGFAGARVQHLQRFGNRITATMALGYNGRATETTALQVGGVKDQFEATVHYGFAKREYARGQLYAARYLTQDRAYVGTGRGLLWEAGYRFRTEYPDPGIRLAGGLHRFSRDGTGDARTARLDPAGNVPGAGFFLPQNFNVVGLHAGFGHHERDNYTRGWRPFADAGILHNSVTGRGHALLLGAAGAVAGHDHLMMYLSSSRGGGGTGDAIREIGVRYQYFFDRY